MSTGTITNNGTETAVVNVHHDIAQALGNACMPALVLLDLSEAFDVIDHEILQTVSGILWKWLEVLYH